VRTAPRGLQSPARAEAPAGRRGAGAGAPAPAPAPAPREDGRATSKVCWDALSFLTVWSAPCLNLSIVTRAHVPRQAPGRALKCVKCVAEFEAAELPQEARAALGIGDGAAARPSRPLAC
jgi:hypothetical protein